MASRRDQERIRALLTEAITVLCKNGLGYNSEFCIDGLLGITVDNDDIFLVKINEKISREKRSLHLSLDHHHERYADRSSVTSASPDQSSSLSQPPTPLTINSHQRTEYQRSESLESSPRKRHWDNHTPEPEPPAKRIQENSESNSITIKEEIVNNGEHHYGVLGEQNGEVSIGVPVSGSKQGSSAWAQATAAAHLSSSLQIYEDSQDDYVVDMPADSQRVSSESPSDRSVMLNGKGRLIAKGMPLPNEERQLIIQTILEAGGNAETGKTPYGVLRDAANSFHIQSSTVHNIWTRFWKYRIDTHGYCPGISDHKRRVNKKCKDRKQRGMEESSVNDISQTSVIDSSPTSVKDNNKTLVKDSSQTLVKDCSKTSVKDSSQPLVKDSSKTSVKDCSQTSTSSNESLLNVEVKIEPDCEEGTTSSGIK